MTYEQIEKSFDEEFIEMYSGDKRSVKSFLKKSFIKYLQAECERLEGEMFANPAEAGQFAMHFSGHNQALDDQITHITNQIKEIEV